MQFTYYLNGEPVTLTDLEKVDAAPPNFEHIIATVIERLKSKHSSSHNKRRGSIA